MSQIPFLQAQNYYINAIRIALASTQKELMLSGDVYDYFFVDGTVSGYNLFTKNENAIAILNEFDGKMAHVQLNLAKNNT